MSIPLTTEVKIGKSDFKIDYQTPVLMVGSCFSDNIGNLFEKYKFNILKNPYGVIYNPLSISGALKLALNNKEIGEKELVSHDNLWHSFLFHGSFSSPSSEEVIQNTNDTINRTHQYLAGAKYLIVTLGTSWVYEYKKTGQIVSNCHKIPDKEFNRYKLPVETITDEWTTLIPLLQNFNPNLKIIFTISPVRHLKDGAYENQLSKSTLFLALEKIRSNFNPEQISYFPSYEIVMDELRDYRFYASDMVHLSEVAIQYLFEKFGSSYFSQNTIDCMVEVEKITQAKEHRFLNSNNSEIKKFATSSLLKIENLERKYPNINFLLEKNYFKNLSDLN